ncbi:MAG: tRNA pseudouridine(38-40) synthase TruA [bacterium]|nr:tRNA pseudouridine(38-40) synthase TruA [bacterium]
MVPRSGAAGSFNRTYKLVLEYDGSDFHGWQRQPGGRTVQAELEAALGRLFGVPVPVVGAGRTDAGVHALGQVASCRADTRYPLETVQRALNAMLPADIRVRSVETAEDGFDARRRASRRVYRYALSRAPLAVGRQYAWHPRTRFDVDAMAAASECLKGLHRWTAFCKRDPEEDRYESEVHSVRWQAEADTVRFEIAAVRFFHHMVRILVGTLVEVGRGALTPDGFRAVLESGDREKAGPTAPPHGLFLVRVEY